MGNNLTIFKQLQSKFGTETKGYQIIKRRKPSKIIPEWANNDLKIREIILRSFPSFQTDPKQRVRASRWVRVIYLYYRRQWTRGQIAEELGLTYGVVDRLISRILYSAKGLRADGKKRK